MNNCGEILENVDLKEYNTYRLEGSIKKIVKPHNQEELLNLRKYIKDNNIPYFILGNGSNVILPNEEFNGIIISLKNMDKYTINGLEVTAEAGIMLPILAMNTVMNNLKGLEWSVGIPGTLGGALFGNAGAYLSDIYSHIKDILVLTKDLEYKKIPLKDINYGYREVDFKDKDSSIIVAATLLLEEGNKEESLSLIADRRRRRQETQPLEYPSDGSVFRNPLKDQPAGKLIEEANLKGYHINDAYISTKHANFIINKGHATYKDIVELINYIKNEIKKQKNIDLICEQRIIEWETYYETCQEKEGK